ncbi:MAG TPA: hypothetical protein VF671_03710, partial [Pseudomonas sp.]|uniref:hypothetical protein n=1 Tax=Pseudomonas sp. TaxID=306 RepID=UPI002ED7C04A
TTFSSAKKHLALSRCFCCGWGLGNAGAQGSLSLMHQHLAALLLEHRLRFEVHHEQQHARVAAIFFVAPQQTARARDIVHE